MSKIITVLSAKGNAVDFQLDSVEKVTVKGKLIAVAVGKYAGFEDRVARINYATFESNIIPSDGWETDDAAMQRLITKATGESVADGIVGSIQEEVARHQQPAE